MAARLVFPRAVEPAKRHAIDRDRGKVKVNDWFWKRRAAVVIAFDGQNVRAPNSFGGLQNHQVGKVAATDENIGGRRFNAMPDAIVVG